MSERLLGHYRFKVGRCLGCYASALAVTTLAFAVRMILPQFFGPPYILFYPSVMLVGILNGLGPGLFATALAAVLAVRWILPVPPHTWPTAVEDWTSLAVFAGMGACMSVVAESFRRTRRRLVQLDTERALRESEGRFRAREEQLMHRYQLLATHSRDIILFVRPSDGRILEANAAASAIYGYSREELISRTIYDLRVQGEAERAAKQLMQSVEEGVYFESIHRKKDGVLFPVEVNSQGAKVDGEVVVFSVVRDISERKRVEEALRKNEKRYRDLVFLSPEAIFISRNDRIEFLNPAAVRLFGASRPEEVLGKSIWEFFHPDGHALVGGRIAKLREGELLPLLEEKIGRLDGIVRQVQVAAVPFEDENGKAIQVILRDITEQRKLELQFQQSQKLESIGRLAGGVAHDFNNLLTVILSCAEELRQSVTSGSIVQREDIEEIYAAGESARELTRQLLAFARKQVVTPVVLDLNMALEGSEKLLRRVLGENIELTVRPERGLWPVRCDPGQIEQVLMNLAVNARDAMPEGGKLIMETSNVEIGRQHMALQPAWMRAGAYAKITVSDTGEGMSAEVREHVFEPFFTTKPLGQGTGLGLATVYGIMKQSEGFILVDSELGRGTSFQLFFPRATQERDAARSAPTVAARRRGAENVLVIEDDPHVRAVTVRALRTAGYRVAVACSGQEALALAQRAEGPLHLVVTDVVMPGLDGPSVAFALRQERPELRVLFVSGYAQEGIDLSVMREPGVQFLNKPFTATSLLEQVRAVLDA